MNHFSEINTADFLRNIARYFLLITGICVFGFALVSGSEEYGGGITGIVRNSPNALPWVLLLILTYISWKWELTGGIIVLCFSIVLLFFFHVFVRFNVVVFLLISTIGISGVFLIASWYLRKVN
ncbi:MAG TPA: hypothetical protein DCX54_01360 [Flavobacteriales bacterium]|nr:hypothetical protein [Flavobacteriales bacterium]